MEVLAQIGYAWVKWKSRYGLRDAGPAMDVRTRAAAKGKVALPELSIGREKRQVLVRTAHAFCGSAMLEKCPVRFDVVATTSGLPGVLSSGFVRMPSAPEFEPGAFGTGLHHNSRYNT